jgi:hypothetical protein
MAFPLLLAVAAATGMAQPPPGYRLEPLLRIGSLDGDQALTNVRHVRLATDGRIYVSQPEEARVRVFDRRGVAVAAIGRRGSGPGEFRAIALMHLVAGRLFVDDAQLGRLTEFSAAGQPLRTHGPGGVTLDPPFMSTSPLAIDEAGRRFVSAMYRPGELRGSNPAALPLFVIHPGRPAVQIGRLSQGNLADGVVRSAGVSANIVLPVTSNTLLAIDLRTGEATFIERPATQSTGGSFQFVRVSATGDTLLSRTLRTAPERVSSAVVDQRREEGIRVVTERTGAPRARIEPAFREGFRVPPFQASVDHVVLGPSRETWLRRGACGLARAQWLVFDAAGTEIGSLTLPGSSIIADVRGNEIAVIERGEWDEYYVAVYRVHRTRAPGGRNP